MPLVFIEKEEVKLHENTLFPQANNFDVLIQMLKALQSKGQGMTKDELAQSVGYNSRQGDYYGQAGVYLGLLEKQGFHYFLTQEAKNLLNLSLNESKIFLAFKILEQDVFAKVANYKSKFGDFPANDEIQSYLKEQNITSLNETTTKRRISTVRSWVKWTEKLIG